MGYLHVGQSRGSVSAGLGSPVVFDVVGAMGYSGRMDRTLLVTLVAGIILGLIRFYWFTRSTDRNR